MRLNFEHPQSVLHLEGAQNGESVNRHCPFEDRVHEFIGEKLQAATPLPGQSSLIMGPHSSENPSSCASNDGAWQRAIQPVPRCRVSRQQRPHHPHRTRAETVLSLSPRQRPEGQGCPVLFRCCQKRCHPTLIPDLLRCPTNPNRLPPPARRTAGP